MRARFILLSVFGIFIPALILPGPDFVAIGGRILSDARNPVP